MIVKCCGQRMDQPDGSLFGYFWIFEILEPHGGYDEMIFTEELKI